MACQLLTRLYVAPWPRLLHKSASCAEDTWLRLIGFAGWHCHAQAPSGQLLLPSTMCYLRKP